MNLILRRFCFYISFKTDYVCTKQTPLIQHTENNRSKKPHDRKNCMKCQQLGYSCLERKGFTYSDMKNKKKYNNGRGKNKNINSNYVPNNKKETNVTHNTQYNMKNKKYSNETGKIRNIKSNHGPNKNKETYVTRNTHYYYDDCYRPSYVAPTVSKKSANKNSCCVIH